MERAVVNFLTRQRVSVLGILQEDTTIHSATLHFASAEDPVSFYFLTGKDSRKCRSLLSGKTMNASLVIGFSEEEFATFQAEGTVRIVTDSDALAAGWSIYGAKYPERKAGQGKAEYVLLQFTPIWWRYTDMKSDPKIQLISDQ